MKKIIYILLVFPVLLVAQSNDQNWVKSKTYKVPTDTILPTATAVEAITQVNYYDGLGRPIQQVTHTQSNSGKDIGGTQDNNLFAVTATKDGGFIVGGNSNSPTSDTKTKGSEEGSDFWVVKLKDRMKPDKEKLPVEAIPNPAVTFTNIIIGFEYEYGTANLFDISGRQL